MDVQYYIKHWLKNITSSSFRREVKRMKRHLKGLFASEKKTTLEDLRKLLVDTLGIKKGDWLLVSSSFGNLNADYSPRECIELLQSIVTKEGLIMMPYYPPINSTEWAEKGEIFDMVETKSGMGVLTNVFSKMANVYKSIHPTKAVCCWGNKAQEIINGHEISTTPFYWDSPYGKLIKHGSKSLCLGLKNIPIFHSYEDLFSEHYYDYYYPDKKKLKVRLLDRREIEVETYVHNPVIIDKCVTAGDYVKRINPPTYKQVAFGLKYIVVVNNNNNLYNTVQQHYKDGDTRVIQ